MKKNKYLYSADRFDSTTIITPSVQLKIIACILYVVIKLGIIFLADYLKFHFHMRLSLGVLLQIWRLGSTDEAYYAKLCIVG